MLVDMEYSRTYEKVRLSWIGNHFKGQEESAYTQEYEMIFSLNELFESFQIANH